MPVLVAEDLRRTFPGPGGSKVCAVDGVDLAVAEGETLGLIGESGSGKSTLGRLLVRLLDADRGTVTLDGHELTSLRKVDFPDPLSPIRPRVSPSATA
ncbi:ATP-binding cassette domain-containing protein, partial [Amycolatopsis sp. NPDC000746]|uniref:ATP-binding cassette domain-containing protein n=1 Tax=Amycolatopsis sp. NPDC000746 TaxID=3154270 RepID=UPI00331CD6EB